MKNARKRMAVESPRRVVLAPRWKVGEVVDVRLGPGLVRARIIEDRGPLGPNGSRMFRVEAQSSPWHEAEPDRFEVVESSLLRISVERPRTGSI